MFDLFLALFGGAYYTSKIKQDKRSSKIYDNYHNFGEEIREKICCSVHEDLNLRSLLRDSEKANEALSFISKELSDIYGDNWREKIKANNFFIGNWSQGSNSGIWNVVLLLYCAKKLHKSAFNHDYVFLSNTNNDVELRMALRIVEKEIQSIYPERHLVCIKKLLFPNDIRFVQNILIWDFDTWAYSDCISQTTDW